MSEARRWWTRQHFLSKLDQLDKLLQELEKDAVESGQIPMRLRKRVQSERARIAQTSEALRSWAVSTKEKLEEVVKKQEKRKEVKPKPKAKRIVAKPKKKGGKNGTRAKAKKSARA